MNAAMENVYEAVRAACPLGEPKSQGRYVPWYIRLEHSGGGVRVELEPHLSSGWTESVGDIVRFRVPARELDDPHGFVASEVERLGVRR